MTFRPAIEPPEVTAVRLTFEAQSFMSCRWQGKRQGNAFPPLLPFTVCEMKSLLHQYPVLQHASARQD